MDLKEAWTAGLPLPTKPPAGDAPPPPPPPRNNATKTTPNEKLARDASNMLLTGHSIVAGVLRIFGMRDTASALVACDEPFGDLSYDALLLDPALCRSITRLGSKSGKLALGAAYVTMLAAVAPVASEEMRDRVAEFRDKVRERKEAKTIRVDPQS